MSTLVIIPAMNEQETVRSVISSIKQCLSTDVLVVDDASTDDTAVIAADAGARVLKLSINLGAWKATQAGIRFAIKNGYRKVVTMDADGQHDASEIDLLLKQSVKSDVVVGACIERGGMLKLLTWKVLGVLSRVSVRDLTSGFRVYNYQAMIALSGKRGTMLDYQDLGVLFLIKHCGMSCSEVPVKMKKRQVGFSRIYNSWISVITYLSYTLILSVSKSIPFVGDAYKQKIKMESKND